MRRARGFTFMEFLAVATAATVLAATSFGALRSLAANSRLHECKGIINHVRSQVALYRVRTQFLPTLATLQAGSYNYYAAQVLTTGYFYSDGPPPEDPFKHVSTIRAVAATEQTAAIVELGANGGTGGWIYNATTGQFWINLQNAEYGTNPSTGDNVRLMEDPSEW